MILETLESKQTEYLKAKDIKRLGMLRLLISQLKYKQIELRPQHQEMTDEIAFKVLKKLIKQKNEAIELAKQAQREDVVSNENLDLEILKEFAHLFPAEIAIL